MEASEDSYSPENYAVVDGRGTLTVFEIYIKATARAGLGGDHRPPDAREVQLRRRDEVGLDPGFQL